MKYFFFQQADQKSILEYFSPSQSSNKRSFSSVRQHYSTENGRRTYNPDLNSCDDSSPRQASKRQKLESDSGQVNGLAKLNVLSRECVASEKSASKRTPLSPVNGEAQSEDITGRSADKRIIVIESESDGEDFDTRTSAKKSKSVSKSKSLLKSRKNRKKIENNSKSPKCNLKTMFSQCSKSNTHIEPVVVSDTDSNMSDSVNKLVSQEASLFHMSKTELLEQTSDERLNRRKESITSVSVYDTKTRVNSQENVKNKAKLFCDSAESALSNSKDKETKSNEWSCSVCTFLNHKDIIYCEMCETPKKSKNNKMCNEDKKGAKVKAATDNIDETIDGKCRYSNKNHFENDLKQEVKLDFSLSAFKRKIDARNGKKCKVDVNSETSTRRPNPDSDDEALENPIQSYDSDSVDNTHQKSTFHEKTEALDFPMSDLKLKTDAKIHERSTCYKKVESEINIEKLSSSQFVHESDNEDPLENHIETYNSDSDDVTDKLEKSVNTKQTHGKEIVQFAKDSYVKDSSLAANNTPDVKKIYRTSVAESNGLDVRKSKNTGDNKEVIVENSAKDVVRSPKQYHFKSVNRLSVGKSPLRFPSSGDTNKEDFMAGKNMESHDSVGISFSGEKPAHDVTDVNSLLHVIEKVPNRKQEAVLKSSIMTESLSNSLNGKYEFSAPGIEGLYVEEDNSLDGNNTSPNKSFKGDKGTSRFEIYSEKYTHIFFFFFFF